MKYIRDLIFNCTCTLYNVYDEYAVAPPGLRQLSPGVPENFWPYTRYNRFFSHYQNLKNKFYQSQN